MSPEQAAIANILVNDASQTNFFVMGPPGQGKTVLIRNVMATLVQRNWAVLMIAPTNVAKSQYLKDKAAKDVRVMLMTSAGFVGRRILPPSTPLTQRTIAVRHRELKQCLDQAKSSNLAVIFDEFPATPCEDCDNSLRIIQGLGAHVKIIAVGDPQQLGPVKAKNPLLSQLFFRADRRRAPSQILGLARRKLQLLSLTGVNHRFKGGDPEHTAMLSQAERQIRAGVIDATARTLNMIAAGQPQAPLPGAKNCTWITATRRRRRELSLRAMKLNKNAGKEVYHCKDPKDERNDSVLIKGERHRMTRAVFEAAPDDGVGESRRIDNGMLGTVKGWCADDDSEAPSYVVFRPDNQRKAYRVPMGAVTTAAVMTIAASQGDTFPGTAVLDFEGIRDVYREQSELLQALCVAITRSKSLRIQNYTPELLAASARKVEGAKTNANPDAAGDKVVVHGLQESMRRLIRGQTIKMIPRSIKVQTVSRPSLQAALNRRYPDNPAAVQIVEWQPTTGLATLVTGVGVKAASTAS